MGRPIGIPKTGGRKKGTPNKSSTHLRNALDERGIDIVKRLLDVIPKLAPQQQATCWLSLLPYLYPKRKAIDEPKTEGPLTFSELVLLAESEDSSD